MVSDDESLSGSATLPPPGEPCEPHKRVLARGPSETQDAPPAAPPPTAVSQLRTAGDEGLATVTASPAVSAGGPPPSPLAPPARPGRAWAGTPGLDHPHFWPVEPGHYEQGPEIGQGGMGSIRAARDRRLGRVVAVKVLRHAQPALQARFKSEVLITARLQHPSIVSLYEAGLLDGGEPFYSMRMVPGRPLDCLIHEARTLPERMALLPRLIAVAEALAYAHARGVIHRDLKPANVLVGEFGETVVIDWGLAKVLGSAEPDQPPLDPFPLAPEQTLAGTVMGTPVFMAPEQAAGKPLDERADVYAIGAMAYLALCGAPPYEGPTGQDVLERVVAGPPVPLGAREPALPRDLVAIVDRAMARDPAHRYRSARELTQDLVRFQSGQLVGVHRYSAAEIARRWLRKHRAAVSVGTVAALVVLVLAVVSVRRIVQAREETERARRLAEQRAGSLLEEGGRVELLESRPLRAAAYLREALQLGFDGPTLRLLLGEAVQRAGAEPTVIEGHAGAVNSVAWSPEGRRILTAGDRGAELREANTWNDIAILRDNRVGGSGPTWARVHAASFSPDGRRAVTVGHDRSARIWDAGSGALLLTLETPTEVDLPPGGETPADAGSQRAGARATGLLPDPRTWTERAPWASVLRRFGADEDLFNPVYCASFSPDGERVAMSCRDHVARVWDSGSGRLVAALEGHRAFIHCICYSPDGRLIVTASYDGSARVWEANTGKLRATLRGHSEAVQTAVFDPAMHFIATGAADGTVRLWHTSNGQPAGEALAHAGTPVRTVQFGPDGRRLLAAGGSGTVRVWDLQTRRLQVSLGEAGESPVLAAVFSPTGRFIATGSLDGTVRVWDAVGGKSRAKLEGHRGCVSSVSFNHDGGRLLSASADGTVRVWDTRCDRLLASLASPDWYRGVVFAPDGRSLVTKIGTGIIHVREARTGLLLRELEIEKLARPSGRDLFQALVSPDGRRVIADGPGSIRVWDVSSGERTALQVPSAGPDVFVRALSRDGSLALTESLGPSYGVRDTGSGRLVASLDAPGFRLVGSDFSPDGQRLVACGPKTTGVWDAGTGRLLSSLRGAPLEASSPRFSPDGRRIATVTRSGVQLWDALTGSLIHAFGETAPLTFRDPLPTFAFSADGGHLAITDGSMVVRVWGTDETFPLVASLEGHTARIGVVAFSPEGHFIATGSADQSARIWEAGSGRLLALLEGAGDTVQALAFSPDGQLLVTTAARMAMVWDLHRESGPANEIAERMARRVPYRLVGGNLLPARALRPASPVARKDAR